MKRNIYILYAMAFLQGMVFYGSVATLYRTSVGLTVAQITLIEGISLVLSLIFEFPWGILADRIGYRRTMIICSGLYLLSKIIFWQAYSFPVFLLERVILAVVVSGLSGVDTSILYMSCSKDNSQTVFAVYDRLGMAGLLCATGLFSSLFPQNLRLTGLATIIPYAVAFALSFCLLEVHAAQKKNTFTLKERLHAVIPGRETVFLILSAGIFFETAHTITVFLNQPKYVQAGMGSRTISLVYMVMTLLSLTAVVSKAVSDRLGDRKSCFFLIITAGVSCLILSLTRSGVLSVIAIGCMTISAGLFSPLFLRMQNDAVISQDRATQLSANNVVIDLVGVFVTVLLGQASNISLSLAFLLGAGFCLAAGICLAVGFRR